MVRDNKVLNTDVALGLIEDQLEQDDELDDLFNRYNVVDVGVSIFCTFWHQIFSEYIYMGRTTQLLIHFVGRSVKSR